MASKTIIDREKTAEHLQGALQVHGPEAAAELARALEPEAAGDLEVPDMEAFQVLLQRRLATSRRRLVAADEAHLEDLRRLKTLRRSRDAAVRELRRLLASLRQGVDAFYGPGASAGALLLEGPTPRDPVALSRTAARVADHLEEAPIPIPESAIPGVDLHPLRWIDLIRLPLARLDRSLKSLAEERRDAVDSLLAKNAAKREYDRLYSASTRMLQEFFRYVGMDEMAETIRPRRRRRSAAQEGLPDEAPIENPAEEATELPIEAPATTRVASTEQRRPRLALVPPARAPDPAPDSLPAP